MVKVTLKRNEGRTISAGGLWIFDNEIEKIEGEYQNGDIVEVVSYKDDHIGKGYINDHSKIMIRILTRRKDEEIDESFFYQRFKDAWEYRKAVVETNCCRIVFSDSDRLPGLIIDKFNEYLVFEIDTLGMDVRKDMLVKQMLKVMERDVDVWGGVRRGDLSPVTGWLGEKIHHYGQLLTPAQLLQSACGAPFDPKYYTDYLIDKYSALYGLRR